MKLTKDEIAILIIALQADIDHIKQAIWASGPRYHGQTIKEWNAELKKARLLIAKLKGKKT